MGLFLGFRLVPSPGPADSSDNGLPAGVDVDVLDDDLLLGLPKVAMERLQQLVEVLAVNTRFRVQGGTGLEDEE
jgi:hypothetical protein